MNSVIRIMNGNDREYVIDMMRVFYNSEAVLSNGSEEIYASDVENCIIDNPYLEGYIFEEHETIQGYGMVAKSFSTEFGKPCVWIEDLYVKEEFRGRGIGSAFLRFISEKYKSCVIRLEAETENEKAIHVYEKSGFSELPYLELIKHT